MTRIIGVKVERWFEQIAPAIGFLGALYVEHRRVSELHATKGWRGVRHTMEQPSRSRGEDEVKFVRALPPKEPKLKPLPEGVVAVLALRHVHPRHKRPKRSLP